VNAPVFTVNAKVKKVFFDQPRQGHFDPDDFFSKNPMVYCVPIRFLVGSVESDEEALFEVGVCSPQWLSREVAVNGPAVGWHFLVVEPLDLGAAVDHLVNLFEREAGEDWGVLRGKLAYFGSEESED
jgi:hypothetical protein